MELRACLLRLRLDKLGTLSMGSKTRSQIRVEQTRRELDRTRAEISEWCAKWEVRDKRRQFATPRRLLEAVLTQALVQLRTNVDKLPGLASQGAIYSQCAQSDRNIAWVRRLWQYFATKFDQRENEKFKRILTAADEIVWSCYAEVFQNATNAAARGPAPLPYIEPLFAAQATPRVDIPPDLRSDVDREFFCACLEQLPISLVALPAHCVDEPWWLIFLGHEVGHHVEFDLLPPRVLFLAFGKFLAAAAAQLIPDQGERWQQWSPEIFADAFSVHSLGPWAARAIAELETKDDLAMLTEMRSGKSAYPAPWVRLSFLAALAERLDGSDTIARGGLPADPLPSGREEAQDGALLRQQAQLALNAVPDIASAVVRESVGQLGTLQQLCGWQSSFFSPGGAVDQWATLLQGDPAGLLPEQTLRTPRLIISGALAAWSQVSAIGEDLEAEKARTNLTENILSIIPRCAEPGTRAAEDAKEIDPQRFAETLTGLLLQGVPRAT
jgi:hypothetical protein